MDDDKLNQHLEEVRHEELIKSLELLIGTVSKQTPDFEKSIRDAIKSLDIKFPEIKAPVVNVEVEKVSNEDVINSINNLKEVVVPLLTELISASKRKKEWVFTINKNGYGVTTSIIAKEQ